MSSELNLFHQTGYTVYAVVFNPSGQVWNTSSSAFETFNASNWTDYDVSLTEKGTSGIYIGDFPTGVTTASVYDYYAYKRVGATPAQSDIRLGAGTVDWTGSHAVVSSSGAMTATDFYAYLLRRGFKRTDKSTEAYEAITDAVQILRRKFEFQEAEEETATTDTITTDGDFKISLESDYGFIQGVVCEDGTDAWPIPIIPRSTFDAAYPDINVTSDRGTPKCAKVYDDTLYIGPIPDKTTYAFRIHHSVRGATISAATTAVPFTDLYRDILSDLATGILFRGVENYQLADYFEAKALTALEDATHRERKNSGDHCFTVKPYEL